MTRELTPEDMRKIEKLLAKLGQESANSSNSLPVDKEVENNGTTELRS